eukprot:471197_1
MPNMLSGWSDASTTNKGIHVINEYTNTQHNSNHTAPTVPLPPSLHQEPSSIPLDNIVSSLFDMKAYIHSKSKVSEYERLIDLLLLKFNDMQSEKFHLLQQINNLEKENDALCAQNNDDDKDNDSSDDEFKDVEFTGLETEQSVILVDYWNNTKKKKHNKTSSIAPWTKYYNRHKQGIGEDLRIAIMSSQKLH